MVVVDLLVELGGNDYDGELGGKDTVLYTFLTSSLGQSQQRLHHPQLHFCNLLPPKDCSHLWHGWANMSQQYLPIRTADDGGQRRSILYNVESQKVGGD